MRQSGIDKAFASNRYVPLSPIRRDFGYHLDDMPNRKTLLIIDGSINLALGIALLIFPSSLVAFLGVPPSQNYFYPNILGGVLFGIAIALFLDSRSTEDRASGLGLLGAAVINLCGGLVLGAWLLFGDLALPVRGSIVLWSLVTVLVGISSFELASRLPKSQN
jgi:hypothetical protein